MIPSSKPNHVSFIDVLLILASTRRFVRFVMPEEICSSRWLRPWATLLHFISLPDERGPEMAQTLHQATEAIRHGEIVGIYAERNVSRIGIMLPFRRELERIMEGVEAPIVPLCLDGVWGSIFSYQAGRFFWKIPRCLPYPVTVSFGEPLPPSATALEVRSAIQNLNTEAWPFRRRTMKPLGRAFLSCARRHPLRFAMADVRVPAMNFASALLRTIFLARRLTEHWHEQNTVGIFLPPSIGGALVNLAALLAGRVPVNLNYTFSSEALASCARQCQLRTIVTSRMFLNRVKVSLPCPTLLLEDIAAGPRLKERLAALAFAWLAPARWLEHALGCPAVRSWTTWRS